MTRFILALMLGLAWSTAGAQPPKVPDRQIPPEIITGMRLLERDFAQALSQDCAPEKCYAKGCVYESHQVVDQPATGALPGLYLEDDPDNGPNQLYLTTATCSFAYEPSVSRRNARALETRLSARMSRGWTQVQVASEKLKPLPASLRESPEPPPEPAAPEPEPEPDAGVPDAGPDAGIVPVEAPMSTEVAGRELWLALLPHFSWMIALVLLTLVALILIWALRRLGRPSPEEQALLAQMLNTGGGDTVPPGEVVQEDATTEAQVAEQRATWGARLARARREGDPAVEALVADLLRNGERRLLAKAVMLFPEDFPSAFPTEGSLASVKYEVAEHLKHTDPALLPSDEAFFEALNRYALASALTAHPDTDLIRGLHDEFGARAMVDLVGALPARPAALLFAMAPGAMQYESVSLLTAGQRATLAEQLLRSNRMDPAETAYLLSVLSALKAGEALPRPPQASAVSDRGTAYDATGALSVLLPRLDTETRRRLVAQAAERSNGRLPAWMKGTLYGEMLLKLDPSMQADLMLEVDTRPLSSWLAAQTDEAREALLAHAPTALQAALTGVEPPASEGERYARVQTGREALAAALQRRIIQSGTPLQALLA